MSRIRLAYPKIPGSKDAPAGHCIAFEKYDGTNLHWVWDRELGWYAFGTRRNRFDLDDLGIAAFNSDHPGYEDAPGLFQQMFATELEHIFLEHSAYVVPEITVFTEFVGTDSFAGLHKADDPKQLVLFDVEIDTGMIGPTQFVADFGHLNSARVVYRGKLTGQFIHDVREGRYDVGEGVICKGGTGGADIWMIKIKTNAYMEQLKQAFQDRWEDYWE